MVCSIVIAQSTATFTRFRTSIVRFFFSCLSRDCGCIPLGTRASFMHLYCTHSSYFSLSTDIDNEVLFHGRMECNFARFEYIKTLVDLAATRSRLRRQTFYLNMNSCSALLTFSFAIFFFFFLCFLFTLPLPHFFHANPSRSSDLKDIRDYRRALRTLERILSKADEPESDDVIAPLKQVKNFCAPPKWFWKNYV